MKCLHSGQEKKIVLHVKTWIVSPTQFTHTFSARLILILQYRFKPNKDCRHQTSNKKKKKKRTEDQVNHFTHLWTCARHNKQSKIYHRIETAIIAYAKRVKQILFTYTPVCWKLIRIYHLKCLPKRKCFLFSF